jgi:hypothetical protein
MKHPLPTTPCKGCGKPIVFAIMPGGGLIPLDTRAPVYWAARDLDGNVIALRVEPHLLDQPGSPEGNAFVSHFSTCAKAAMFSKKGKL